MLRSHRPRLCFLLVLAGLLASRPSRADDAPTFADRTDAEVAGADRTVAFLANPLAAAAGVFGLETDVVLGSYAALSLEGAVFARPAAPPATVLGLGMLVFPLGYAMHGLYLDPRVEFARSIDEPLFHLGARDVLGVGATAGWQWAWDYGLTARVGGGALLLFGGSCAAATAGSPVALGSSATLALDSSVGWAF